jgi:hypothetical protein
VPSRSSCKSNALDNLGSRSPGSIFEIDCTNVDLRLVRNRCRRPVGKFMMTFLIDRATSVLVGCRVETSQNSSNGEAA